MIDSIGARLRQARELRRLTLQQVSETTKVRTHYLQALENDDLSAIPSMAQARGFLRIYADFLELDLADLVPQAPASDPSVSESASQASTGIPSQDAVASKAVRPNLWTSLRNRLARRPNNSASRASVPEASSVLSQNFPETTLLGDDNGQPGTAQPPESMPASTEVKTKTSRRPKINTLKPSADASGPDMDAVKKNVGR